MEKTLNVGSQSITLERQQTGLITFNEKLFNCLDQNMLFFGTN